jgi:hypothetical protein
MKMTAPDPYAGLDPEIGDELAGDSEESAKHPPDPEWPTMDKAAYYGLAGEIVSAIGPYTEGDPVAVLLQTLAIFASLVGPRPHVQVQSDRHPARIFVALVGQTSKGRKGTSFSTPREIGRRCDPTWAEDRIRTGLSSGEGLIFHVRDGDNEKDTGVTDKRLLAIEPEFSVMLRIMSRDGNSLSGVLRQAWDSGDLSTLTRNNPLKATDAHLTLIGHTSAEELVRNLDQTEKANGFANRILWACVRRSKMLPDGESFPEAELQRLSERLRDAVTFARSCDTIKRDPLAAETWRKVYPVLSEGRPGLSGAVCNRSEAQTLRLSLIYALIDKSTAIRVPHLEAALAIWEYCERSVLYLFGDRTGDPVADRIIDELRSHGELTRDDVVNLFNRHRTNEVDRALSMLERIGRVQKDQRATGGRPVTVYRVARKAR